MANTGAIKAGRAYVEIFVDKNPLIRGLRVAEKSLHSWGAAVSSMGRKTMLAGTSIVGALVGASIKAAAMGHELELMASKTGMSVETLSGLSYVAKLSGVEMDALGKGIKFMHKNIFAANGGLKGAVKALGQLGLTVKDLKGMTPEEQFAELAGRIGALKSPTDRVALAMKIFGRAGTELLPMFALGKVGINQYIEEARRLGLIMSTEDAEAAGTFYQELKKLSSVMKMGLFRVGAALIPILTDMADKIVKVVAKVTEWIKTNKGVVVMALYIGAGITAAGAAFYALGLAMTFSAKILSVVLGAFNVLKTVLMFILTPLGAIVTGLTAGVAAFLYFSGYGAQRLSWLGDRFKDLKQDATMAFTGISQALAKGDIALAAKILWLTLKMEFLKGKEALLSIWLTLKNKFLEYWNGLGYAMVLVWDTAVYGVKIAWAETVAFLIESSAMFKEAWGDTIDWVAKKMMGVWIWWQKLMDPNFDEKYATTETTKYFAQEKAARTAKTDTEMRTADNQRVAAEKAATDKYNADVAAIAAAFANDISANDKEAADRLKAVADELAAAQAEWKTALDKAAEFGAAAQPKRPALPGFSDVSMTAASAAGTFSAWGLGQIGVGSVMQKIADYTQRTAEATEDMADNAGDGAAFD